jgi:acyl-CoA synthetase (AMP-forming)/AMP-acid ligase II
MGPAPTRPPAGTTGRPKGVTLSHAALHCQSMAKLLEVGGAEERNPAEGGSEASAGLSSVVPLFARGALCQAQGTLAYGGLAGKKACSRGAKGAVAGVDCR